MLPRQTAATANTLCVFGIEARPPVRGGRKFRTPPLHRTPTSSTLSLQTSSPEGASFGRKRNFWQSSTPPLENSGARWTALTRSRKSVIRVGKAALKNVCRTHNRFRVISDRIHKKRKIPNFRQSPSTYAWQGRGARMRYMRCSFEFTGPICDLKFFELHGVGLRNLRRICARALYDRACLNLNNSETGRPPP